MMKPGCAAKAEDAFIRTCTGIELHPWNLKPEEISLADSVQAAVNICRFNGNCQRRYSNLAHMLWCYYQATKRGFSLGTRLLALTHDLHEVVSLDMNSPLKDHIPGYREFEEMVKAPFAVRLGLDRINEACFGIVKRIDNEAYLIEAKYLQNAERFAWLRSEPVSASPLADFKRLLFTSDDVLMQSFKTAYALVEINYK